MWDPSVSLVHDASAEQCQCGGSDIVKVSASSLTQIMNDEMFRDTSNTGWPWIKRSGVKRAGELKEMIPFRADWVSMTNIDITWELQPRLISRRMEEFSVAIIIKIQPLFIEGFFIILCFWGMQRYAGDWWPSVKCTTRNTTNKGPESGNNQPK